MEKAVSGHLVSESMVLSRDVMWLLSSVQKQWEEQDEEQDEEHDEQQDERAGTQK